jgi:polysaccharide export outer membrane protein
MRVSTKPLIAAAILAAAFMQTAVSQAAANNNQKSTNSAATDAANIDDRSVDQSVKKDATAMSQPNRALKISSGDLVDIKVYGVPELTDSVRVSGAGDVSLPLIGAVKVDGLTSDEAEKVIEKKLLEGGFLKDPHVTVFVKEYVTQGISVMGEVQHPGIYPLMGARRLFDALSAAGGTTTRAGKIVTITHREKPTQPQSVSVSSDAGKSPASNVEIFPGDTVVVSRAGVVYVVGEVVRPSGFIMDNNENLTVLQAIALAQGVGRTAALNNAKLIRKKDGQREEIAIPLRLILEGKSPDLALQGDDIVFVPNSAAKGAARRTMDAVIQMATGMAVYAR